MKKQLIRFVLIVLGVLVSLTAFVAAAFLLSNHMSGSQISSGGKRSYPLYVPETYDSANPVPLVISIHGYADWPAHQAQVSHWNKLAD